MKKATEIKKAKKRRARLLARFIKSGLNESQFAKKNKLTRQRINELLRKAHEDILNELTIEAQKLGLYD